MSPYSRTTSSEPNHPQVALGEPQRIRMDKAILSCYKEFIFGVGGVLWNLQLDLFI